MSFGTAASWHSSHKADLNSRSLAPNGAGIRDAGRRNRQMLGDQAGPIRPASTVGSRQPVSLPTASWLCSSDTAWIRAAWNASTSNRLSK